MRSWCHRTAWMCREPLTTVELVEELLPFYTNAAMTENSQVRGAAHSAGRPWGKEGEIQVRGKMWMLTFYSFIPSGLCQVTAK